MIIENASKEDVMIKMLRIILLGWSFVTAK